MKKFFRIFFIAILAEALITSCSNDDDVKTPTTINPNGIILLSAPKQVVAGNTATIKFRVNPSNVNMLSKENISLDCVAPDIYNVEISDDENQYNGTSAKTNRKSKASYVQASDNYTIIDFYPDSLNGQQLKGQYIIRVQAQATRNIIDRSLWTVVCSYKTNKGDTVDISSETFNMLQIPQPKDGVFAWSPQAISLKVGDNYPVFVDKQPCGFANTTINGVKWFVAPRNYRNALTNAVITYDYDEYIANASVTLLNGSDTIPCNYNCNEYTSSEYDGCKYGYSAIPNVDKEPIASIYNDTIDKKYVTFTNCLCITDNFGNKSVWKQDVNYVVPEIITLYLNLPESITTGSYKPLDIEDKILEYGIDDNMIKRYPHCSIGSSFVSSESLNNSGCYVIETQRDNGLGIDQLNVVCSKPMSPETFCKGIYYANSVTKYAPTNKESCDPYHKFLNIIFKFVPKQ